MFYQRRARLARTCENEMGDPAERGQLCLPIYQAAAPVRLAVIRWTDTIALQVYVSASRLNRKEKASDQDGAYTVTVSRLTIARGDVKNYL